MSDSVAYLGTLAFVGWALWLRERTKPTVADQLRALAVAAATQAYTIRQLKTDLSEARSIVDNLQMRSGLTSKR